MDQTAPSPFSADGTQYAWDSTSLKLAEECPRKYQYVMLENWTPTSRSVHLEFGGHYATALEHYHKRVAQGESPEDAILAVVHEALVNTWNHDRDEAGKPVPGTGEPAVFDHNTKTRENLIRSIVWYLDQFGPNDPLQTITLKNGDAAVELSFKIEVDNGLIFAGHLDRMVEYSGDPYVQDQKAQPLSECVLTPHGWKPLGDLSVGDAVIGVDGLPHAVTAIIPKGEVPIFRVEFVDGTSTRCAWDHLWEVQDQFGKSYVLSMEEIATAPAYKKFSVPLVEPVQHPEADLPLHPHALGLLLGDGYLCGSCIQFSDKDGVEAATLASLLPPGDEITKAASENYTWIIKGGQTKKALIELGLFGKRSGGKFIPAAYLIAAEDQRRDLLRGLLRTDGCAQDGKWLYDSTSEQLVKDVCQLIRSLGGTASYHSRSGNAFRAHLRMPEWRKGVRSRYIKRITKEPYTEQAACLKVAGPRELYVTENYIVTHNTTGATITPRFYDQFDPDIQMSMYTFAGKMIFDIPVKGVIIDAAQIAVGFTRFERGFTFRTEGKLNEWYDDMMKLVERTHAYGREGYFPMNRSSCDKYGGCMFRRICSRDPGQRDSFLRADFTKREAPWNPLQSR